MEKASISGGEVFIQWQTGKHLKVSSFLAYNFGENLTKNEPLRRIPPLNSNTSVRYSINNFYTMAELAWASEQNRLAQGDKEDNRIPKGGTPGWQVINIFAGYHYKLLDIRVSAQNLLNEDYRTHGSGINGVGRSILLSCQYRFGSIKIDKIRLVWGKITA